jgi:hypothetical protein
VKVEPVGKDKNAGSSSEVVAPGIDGKVPENKALEVSSLKPDQPHPASSASVGAPYNH